MSLLVATLAFCAVGSARFSRPGVALSPAIGLLNTRFLAPLEPPRAMGIPFDVSPSTIAVKGGGGNSMAGSVVLTGPEVEIIGGAEGDRTGGAKARSPATLDAGFKSL